MKNILRENMRRFNTKNLNEEETCKEDDSDNLPLCSDLIKKLDDKNIRGPYGEDNFYTVKLNNGCSGKCRKTKEELDQ